METMIKIEVVKGPERGKTYCVPRTGFSIGRSTEPDEVSCALMDDVSVSRRHAVGRMEGDRIVLEDWPGHPSKAGLVLGGRRLATLSLAVGEMVTLGRTSLVFRLPGDGRSRGLNLPPVWRRWLCVGALLAMMAAGTAAWRGRMGGAVQASAGNGMDQAWSARCSGDLEDAIRLLRETQVQKGPNEGAVALERECQRYARLFEGPRKLEESLRLDEAKDAWARVALGMRSDDPLRNWVETGCVARLSRQLAELRP
jgi:hypothetical protein